MFLFVGLPPGGCLPAGHFTWSFEMWAARQHEKGQLGYD
jgi:hypothetical protein